jgi:nicotinamide-nucleotide amidase
MDMFNTDELNKIRNILTGKHETIAAAESVTAGLLQVALAAATTATDYFQGGITTYNLGQKCKHLSINPITALTCNCVSEQTAQEMASGAAALFISDWGIGVTGYATPVPESKNAVFAICAIVFHGKTVCTKKIQGKKENAFDVQVYYVDEIVSELLRQVSKRKKAPTKKSHPK